MIISHCIPHIQRVKMFQLFGYSKRKLAKDLMSVCKDIYPGIEVTYDKAADSVSSVKGVIFLGNIYNLVKVLSQNERLDYLRTFVNNSTQPQDITYENSADLIFPRIKSKAEQNVRKYTVKEQMKEIPEVLSVPFTNHCSIEFAIDYEVSFGSFSKESLKEIGLSGDELFALAIKNLRDTTDTPFVEVRESVYASEICDDNDAARILLIDEINALSFKGDPVAFIPTTTNMFLCGSEDYENLTLVSNMCMELVQNQRTVSLSTLILKEGVWSDFHPEKTDEYSSIHNLRSVENQTMYNESKAVLDRIHEAEQRDVFIANYTLYQQEGSPFYQSVGTLTETVHTWLPQSDVIFCGRILNNDFEPLGKISVDNALSTFPNHFKLLEGYPIRIEVKEFPPVDELQRAIDHEGLVKGLLSSSIRLGMICSDNYVWFSGNTCTASCHCPARKK